jgi:hypothetical protein
VPCNRVIYCEHKVQHSILESEEKKNKFRTQYSPLEGVGDSQMEWEGEAPKYCTIELNRQTPPACHLKLKLISGTNESSILIKTVS